MQTSPPTAATASLRALMAGIIDYAGLFPPAALPLDEAIRNYARYLNDPDRWMLGRFICPVARLGELLPYLQELFDPADPLVISALGRGGKDAAEFRHGLGPDLGAIAAFREAAGERAVVDVMETRLPIVPLDELPQMLDALEQSQQTGLRPFCEVGFDAVWRDSYPRMVAPLMVHPGLGCKLRTGGVEAGAFPSTEQVAAAIATCRHAGIPMKFTAGLHHPLRHFNKSVQTKMHGFLNVFVACILARCADFEESQIRRVLEEADPCCFRFRDYGLSFGEHAVPSDQIVAARRDFAISFGSCSFDEPRQDLRQLGLL
jgi:hypothetical protein